MTDAADPAAAPPAVPARSAQDWRILLAVFWVTSMVEGLGVSQIFALLPTYLREMGVAPQDRLAFIGIFSALIFVVGMPLVPLWGAWADKYSRKVVIIRSALVEAVVFAAVALAREPWQLAMAMLLIGFQLGNTGIMLAGIRDVAPLRRIGTAIARVRGVRSGRVRGRAGPGRHPHRRLRLGAVGGLRVVGAPVGRDRGPGRVRVEGGPPGGRADRPDRRSRLRQPARRPDGSRDPPDLPDLRHLVPGDPDEPAVHPRARRGDHRPRDRSCLGDRAGRRDRGPRRGARLAARRRDRRPDRLSAGPRGGARRGRRRPVPDAAGGVARGARLARGRARRGDRKRQLDGLRPARHGTPTRAAIGRPQPGLPAALRRRDDRPGRRRGGGVGQRRERVVRRRWLHLHVRGADDRAATRSHRRAAAGRRRAARDGEYAEP